MQALKMEAELIASLGTIAGGGILTNAVLPSGKVGKPRPNVVTPLGAPEKAQLGLSMLKEAVLEFAQANQDGVSNSDVCHVPWIAQCLCWRLKGLSELERSRAADERGALEARRAAVVIIALKLAENTSSSPPFSPPVDG